jgi:hypothetical protein
MAGYTPVPIVERRARLALSLPCGSSRQTVLSLLPLGYAGKSGSWEKVGYWLGGGTRRFGIPLLHMQPFGLASPASMTHRQFGLKGQAEPGNAHVPHRQAVLHCLCQRMTYVV